MNWLTFVTFAICVSYISAACRRNCSLGEYNFRGGCHECAAYTDFSIRNVRVAGGVDAVHHSYPSIVLIWFEDDSFCEGTLITPCVLVTAAHCVKDKVIKKLYFGVHDITQKDSDSDVQMRLPNNVRIHEDYQSCTYLNDIALVYFDPVDLSRLVDTACLPAQSDTYAPWTRDSYVAGWGQLSYGGLYPDILQNAKLNILPNTDCDNTQAMVTKDYTKQLCAGDAPKDRCIDDDGGALYTDENQKPYAAGIISYGYDCGVDPSIFTRVSHYHDWIVTYW